MASTADTAKDATTAQGSIGNDAQPADAPKIGKAERKKLAQLARKAEAIKKNQLEPALRPKEKTTEPVKTDKAGPLTTEALEENVFNSSWLKDVYEEKPVKNVFTRFPPEPNGFLHIGHAKAITINFGFAKFYGGKCYLRYDDTNPEKEKEVYFTAIQDMVKWLGFEPYQITYSSDHFEQLYNLAEKLIGKDGAYVCYCSREEVNMQRGGPDNNGRRYACEHRSRPVEESLSEFRAMRDGKYKAGEAFLRMKQKLPDLTEGNPQMWDMPAYRVIEKNYHHRTGDQWRIYPTYDFTHCIVDAFENISHSLCTTEFTLSRVSYNWLLEQLDMKVPGSEEKGPMQREYGRLSLEGTILSKRKIQMLVEGTIVEKKLPDGTVETRKIPPTVRGWDDPRLFTLVGLRRRGIPAMAMRHFVLDLGVTNTGSPTPEHRFVSTIQDYLDVRVPRLMLVLEPVKVVIEDLTPEEETETSVPFGKDVGGSRLVKLSKEIYIDASDFREEDYKDYKRLAPNKIVGLLHAGFIQATSYKKDDSGRVVEIRAVKADDKVDAKSKVKPARIHWADAASSIPLIARKYNALFLTKQIAKASSSSDAKDLRIADVNDPTSTVDESQEDQDAKNPESLDWKTGGWTDYLNPDSEISYPNAIIERGLSDLIKSHETTPSGASDDLVRFQGMRIGFFCIDKDKEDGKIVLNQIVPLKESKAKEAKKDNSQAQPPKGEKKEGKPKKGSSAHGKAEAAQPVSDRLVSTVREDGNAVIEKQEGK